MGYTSLLHSKIPRHRLFHFGPFYGPKSKLGAVLFLSFGPFYYPRTKTQNPGALAPGANFGVCSPIFLILAPGELPLDGSEVTLLLLTCTALFYWYRFAVEICSFRIAIATPNQKLLLTLSSFIVHKNSDEC